MGPVIERDNQEQELVPLTDTAAGQLDRSEVLGRSLKDVAQWCVRVLVILATLFVAWHVLRKLWVGVLPVVLSIIVCTVLAPVTSWLRRHRVPGGLAAAISILGSLGVVGALFSTIAPDMVRQTQSLYLQAFDAIQSAQLWLTGPPLNLDPADLDDLVNEAVSWLQRQSGAIAEGVFSGICTLTSVAVTLGVVVILSFFFLKDGHAFLPWMRGVTGRRQGWHLTELLTRAWRNLSGFIRVQALVSLIDAVFIGIGLVIIGVPMALALAVITFAAGFIPIVGAFTAGALAVIVALISLGVPKALATFVLILAVQQLEGNVLSPVLQSKAMKLHPVIVLFAVTVGGSLFGIIGAFLAVPVAAMIAVALRYSQDILMLRSGEKTLDDVEFLTQAGRAIGQFTEKESRAVREKLEHTIDVGEVSNPDEDPRPQEANPSHSNPSARFSDMIDTAKKLIPRSKLGDDNHNA